MAKTIISSIFFLFSIFVYAKPEGTAEVMPNNTNGTSLFVNPNLGFGSYFNCPASQRIYFNIKNHTTENFYFGFHGRQRTPSNGTVANDFFRIRNSAGTVVSGPTAIPNSGTGFINTYAEATTGPNIGGLTPAGYTPLTYDPPSNGDYWIEIYRSNDGGVTMDGTSSGEAFYIYFDFTVATATNTQFDGRVFSQAWSFITYDPSGAPFTPSINFSFEGDYFGYTNDSSIIRIEFGAGFRPLGFILAMNFYGVDSTGNFLIDRESVYTGSTTPTLPTGFKVFLNTPDTSIFKTSVEANPPVLTSEIYGCEGAYYIPYFIDKAGDISILLDLNGVTGYQPGTADVIIEQYNRPAGNNVASWNGNNGLGVPVADGATITIEAVIFRGRTNIPIYDAELNINGMSVTSIFPTTGPRELYWNDLNLEVFGTCGTESTDNTTGPGIDNSVLALGTLGPTHAWNGDNPSTTVPAPNNGSNGSASGTLCDDFGNARTINTWFYASDVSSGSQSRALPKCDNDGDGVDNIDDLDDDNDGIPDLTEHASDPLLDADADLIPNYLDPDFAGFVDVNFDGVNDVFDFDLDGIINSFDLDSDGDGFPDIKENNGPDTNNDGLRDGFVDLNGNGLNDNVDPNCTAPTTRHATATAGATSIGTPANALNAPDGASAGINDVTDQLDLDLGAGFFVRSGATLTVRAARSNANAHTLRVSQSNDDVTYSNPQDFVMASTTLSNYTYNVSGSSARYFRFVMQVDAGSGQINLDAVSYSFDPCGGVLGTPLTIPNSDGDGRPNYLDIDADNDGIVDIIEMQATSTYTPPSGSDQDGDGIDDAFDSFCAGRNISGIVTANAGTAGTVTNPGNIIDGDNTSFGILDNGTAAIDALLQSTVPSGVTITIRARRNDAANANFIVQRSFDDITYTQSQEFTSTVASQDFSYVLGGAANYIRLTRNGVTANNNDVEIYYISYSYVAACSGSSGFNVNPVNTDGTGNPDYLDTDSDDDSFSDAIEGWDTNADRIANTVFSNTDSDNDGLDNAYDTNDSRTNPTNGNTPTSFPNLWAPATSERDWRDSEDDITLPVNLLFFDAKTDGEKVFTFWATSAEINNDFFTVQRSQNGRTWEDVGQVDGAGNSNVELHYNLEDEYPLQGLSYYRLKQTDFDGKFSFSNVASVVINKASSSQHFWLYPNPASFTLVLNAKEEMQQFDVIAISGNTVLSQNANNQKMHLLNIEGLESGVYFIRVMSNNKTYFEKFIKL